MDNELQQLKKEIQELKRELQEVKGAMRQEIISQQQNSRDIFRTDRGQFVLKKNFRIDSRKAVTPEYDNIASLYFNAQARSGVNALYIGHDGGNGQRNANEIAMVATHDPDRPFSLKDQYNNGSFSLLIQDSADGKRPESFSSQTVLTATKSKYLYQNEDVEGHSSFLMASGEQGIAGIATTEMNDPTQRWYFPVCAINKEPVINMYGGKQLRVNVYNSDNTAVTSSLTGVTGSFTNANITVQNGIVVSASSGATAE